MFSGENVGVFGGTNIAVGSGGTANISGSSGTYSRAFEMLMAKVSSRALHNSGEISDPPKCHPGTRIEVLDVLITWAMATTYLFPIKWLTGPAGAGKSAIMRTFAGMLVQHSLLLASFFFFRSDDNRNNASQLVPSIAYQICLVIPSIRPHIERAIDLNPLVFRSTLCDQIHTLIVDPILRFLYDPNSVAINPFPRIILIDGLDECQGEDAQLEILDVFYETVRTLPIPIAIVIASRPEYQIRSSFDLGQVNRSSSRIVLDDSFAPDKDIETFYLAEFSEIRRSHPMRSHLRPPVVWPSPQVIIALVRNASGQFIYASTIIKFVRSIRHDPSARLDMILGLIDRGTSKPFQQLDLVYATILLNVQEEDLPAVLRVLGIILTPPSESSAFSFQSPDFLERLLGYREGEVRRLFIDLESLLAMPSDSHYDIRIFHTSLGDFLFDKSRAEDLSIDKVEVYAEIASLCISQFFSEFEMAMMLYITNQFPVSLKNALPTDKLHQIIVACNMEKLINLGSQLDNPHCYPNYGLMVLTPMFLSALQSSTFSNVGALYTRKVASFKKSLIPKMSVYLDNEHLFGLLMVSLATELQQTRTHQFLEALGLVPTTKLIRWDRVTGLDLHQFCPNGIFGNTGFTKLISDFLACPGNQACARKVQTQCTNLAVQLLYYINQNCGLYHQECCYYKEARGMCLVRKLLPHLFKHALVRDDLTNIARVVLSSSSEYMKGLEIEEVLTTYMQLAIQRDPDTHKGSSPRPRLSHAARQSGPQTMPGSDLQIYPQNNQHGLVLQQSYPGRFLGGSEHPDSPRWRQAMMHPEPGLQVNATSRDIGITDMIPRSVLYRELSREDRDTTRNFDQQNDPLLTQRQLVEFPGTADSSQHIDRLLSKCQRREWRGSK